MMYRSHYKFLYISLYLDHTPPLPPNKCPSPPLFVAPYCWGLTLYMVPSPQMPITVGVSYCRGLAL